MRHRKAASTRLAGDPEFIQWIITALSLHGARCPNRHHAPATNSRRRESALAPWLQVIRKQMADLETREFRNREQWRTWLEKHHSSSPGVWLVRHKRHTGVKSIPYEDIVREALCYGWIDSLVKRLDDDRYVLKVTPRRATSKWSDLNRKRWAELKAAALLASAGKLATPTKKYLRPTTGHTRSSHLRRQSSQDRSQSVAVLSEFVSY